ncbi:tRNA pseudouridine(13) synthase TruD [Caldicellulosiruptor morganii]|uniref:tRNA pseudouridine(13) synthase TruD n=1 Tax=Caldicellulosiruptor morganii TaxID=1387555 RepID=A0ABY7BKW6_9FIRM|nr:tRNA pseudouridine(13) synthase TruD [Caldicellulosiruptor morganii]WAM33492.1 tRNA pseudouridine(13) synthase TruD [Caldicellulosiruptor morganii]
MKIKVLPEDFIVREKIDIEIKPSGRYKIYLLKKKHWNTIDALRFISKENKIPFEKIGCAGRKDRHALTFQYISVPREYDINFNRENVKVEFVGYSDDFVSPLLLKGNYFEMVIRKIKSRDERIFNRIGEIEKFGFPNYFDDQRFGSVEREEEFIGEKIAKKHYNGALKLYFTVIHPEDKKEEKERKKAIFELWGEFEKILPLCKTKVEKEIIKTLMKGKSRHYLIEAVNLIPKEEMSMFFSAYQSYIWNKTLSLILPYYADLLKPVKGKIMDYLIYTTLSDRALSELKGLQIPTVSSRIPFVNSLVNNTILEILNERGLKPSDFELKKIKKSFYKSFLRPAIVFPENLEFSDFEEDDFYSGYFKLKLKFHLPAGSFATMFFKSLTLYITNI